MITQLKQQKSDGGLSQNFSTITIQTYQFSFFSDPFFVKSTNTLVITIVYSYLQQIKNVYVVPMASKKLFFHTLTKITIGIGVQMALIVDSFGEKTSNEVA